MKIALWPSGHSSSYTVVAEYQRPKDAESAAVRLEKRLKRLANDLGSDCEMTVVGKTLVCSLYTNYESPDPLADAISADRPSADVAIQDGFSSLLISVDIGAPLRVYPLLGGTDEARAIKYLMDLSRRYEEHDGVVTFRYSGEEIYLSDEEKFYFPALTENGPVEFTFEIEGRKNWTVKDWDGIS